MRDDIKNTISAIFFTLLLALSFESCAQSSTSSGDRNYQMFAGVIDTINAKGADTVLLYGKLCSHCIFGTEEDLKAIYIKEGQPYFIYAQSIEGEPSYDVFIQKKASSKLAFDIFFENQEAILNILQSELSFEGDTLVEGDKIVIRKPLSHGVKHVFYVQVGETEYSGEICCGVELNQIWRNAFEVWLLASAINNE